MLSKLMKSKFFKNSIFYTLGSMMTPLIGFIMLPIYTNYLSPTEYGVMTTVQTLVGMFQLFLLLSLHGAITRFYYDYLEDRKKQSEYLGSIFLFVLLFATVIALLMMVFYQQLGTILFSSIPIYPFYFYMIGLSWLSAIFTMPTALLRAQERAVFFVIVNISKVFFIMILSIYFIVFRGLGVEGALLAQLIVTAISVIFLLFKQFPFLKLSFNLKFIKYSLVFSLPLLPHVASGWIINSSDRIILEKFITLDQIGIYALAAQTSMVLSFFYNGVNNALVPRYTKLRKENRDEQADRLLRTFFWVVIVFGVFSIPISMIGAKLLSSETYNEAIWLIPYLIVAQIVKGLYFIPVAKLFYSKRTKSIASSSTIAAIANIGINFMFIPIIGIYGAVISTIVAELIRTLLIYKASVTNIKDNNMSSHSI